MTTVGPLLVLDILLDVGIVLNHFLLLGLPILAIADIDNLARVQACCALIRTLRDLPQTDVGVQ